MTGPNLYTEKSSNIFKTWVLFTGFFIFIIGIGYIFGQVYNNPAILVYAVLFSTITSFISYWYSDKIVLGMYRATPVDMKNNPELYRIVENLAITAGLPTPTIYIVPEAQINAFATGRDPKHAVIAVTQGAMRKLDRSELEGVIAHEMSHIGNRDMLVGTMAVVLVGFISLLSDMFMRSLWWGGLSGQGGRRSDDRNNSGGILMLIGIVIAILAPISASLLQLAISRKREFLADASGALLTRYPDGLASALEKIARDMTPMAAANNTTSHLWIDDPFNGDGEKVSWWHSLFMTHPPIKQRIAVLRGMKMGGE